MEMSVRWLVEMVEEMVVVLVMVVVKIVVVLVMVTFCPWGDVYQHLVSVTWQ